MKHLVLTFVLSAAVTSCYFVDFFARSKSFDQNQEDDNSEVLGVPLGDHAGDKSDEALAAVYAVSTTYSPSAVRPDADLFARRLLRQFRAEGSTMAREIGRIERFKVFLGGASEDFKNGPAQGYDATSVLAEIKVAEELCKGLVNPTAWNQPGWNTILPYPVGDVRSNLKYLSQRFTGVPNSKISDTALDQLEAIYESNRVAGDSSYASYVAPCATLALDAKSMFF